MATKFDSVDEYIDSFDGVTKARLLELRLLVKEYLPDAEEGLNYNIPAYKYDGSWVFYFSGYTKHLSVAFGGPIGKIVEEFKTQLSSYKCTFSAMQFPHDQVLPKSLLHDLIVFRISNMNICDK